MNEVPIIRKGEFKHYLTNGIFGGLVLGLILFLFALLDNSVEIALTYAFALFLGMVVLFAVLGFFGQEYFLRKRKIAKLCSAHYTFLDEQNFRLHPDLYFTGIYKDYAIRVVPVAKWIQKNKYRQEVLEYDYIEIYFHYTKLGIAYSKIKGLLMHACPVENIHLTPNFVGYVPKNLANPDFKLGMDSVIEVLENNNLEPFPLKDVKEWERIIGKQLSALAAEEEKQLSDRVLKIGKLDIAYTKAKRKEKEPNG